MSEHELPMTPWVDFMAEFDWRQGEHVTIVGPTGTGKTTLIRALMPKRYDAGGAVAVLATKPRDKNLDAWARADGLQVVRSWPPKAPQRFRPPRDIILPDGRELPWENRVMIWPQPDASEYVDVMAATHKAALQATFWQGNWCVVGEELLYLCKELGLSKELVTLWTQGRSNGLTLIGATQRPVDIPLYAYSMASHLFFFGDNDEVNLSRIQGIGGMSGKNLQRLVASLPYHDVLYVGTRERKIVRTRVPLTH